MQNQIQILSFIFISAIGCNDKSQIHDFAFIRIGTSEVLAPFYLQSNLDVDSIVILLNATDEIDTLKGNEPKLYKIGLPRSTKQIISNFIEYSCNMQNGLIYEFSLKQLRENA